MKLKLSVLAIFLLILTQPLLYAETKTYDIGKKEVGQQYYFDVTGSQPITPDQYCTRMFLFGSYFIGVAANGRFICMPVKVLLTEQEQRNVFCSSLGMDFLKIEATEITCVKSAKKETL